jgi:putative transcriptional regulator
MVCRRLPVTASGRILTFVLRALTAALLVLAAPTHAADAPIANGVFLVAKPDMPDPYFRDTVILLTEPEVGGGPVGVIINRPLDAKLSENVPDLEDVPEEFDDIYAGGPVARGEILFLVRTDEPPEHALRVLSDVYLSGDRDLLDAIVSGETEATDFRAYAGFSSWAPDQLQAEIARGGWYVIKADADTIFSADPSTMWQELIKRITGVLAQQTDKPDGSRAMDSHHAVDLLPP